MSMPLSTIEHLIHGNLMCRVGFDTLPEPASLRQAVAQVQQRHPALRMRLERRCRRLHALPDRAPAVPFEVFEATSAAAAEAICRAQLQADFPEHLPQLRVAVLRWPGHNELLLTVAHRISDGMGAVMLVRELLQASQGLALGAAYPAVGVREIAGLAPAPTQRQRLLAAFVNATLALIPRRRTPPVHHNHALHWRLGPTASGALRRHCRMQGVSMHAVLLAALGEALASLPPDRRPTWIQNPVDARRGRVAVLRDDMLVCGGGSFRIEVAQAGAAVEFWTRVRQLHAQVQDAVELECVRVPVKYRLLEQVRPPSPQRIHALVALGDALRAGHRRFSLSNLGPLALDVEGAPFRVTDFRFLVHSFSFRLFAILAYAVDGCLGFSYAGDRRLLDDQAADALGGRLCEVLERQAQAVPPVAAAATALAAWR